LHEFLEYVSKILLEKDYILDYWNS